MQHFKVESMSCNHCVGAIEQALKEADPSANIKVDLSSKSVALESTLDQQSVLAALDDAGYEDALPVEA